MHYIAELKEALQSSMHSLVSAHHVSFCFAVQPPTLCSGASILCCLHSYSSTLHLCLLTHCRLRARQQLLPQRTAAASR